MIILAVDTTTDWLSVALCDDLNLIEERHDHRPRQHSELLMESTRDLLEHNGVLPKDIGLLAVSHGPGSFTGTRIGVSTWKGLAVGLEKPLVGVSSLEALADSANEQDGPVCPMLDAKMDEVFVASFTCTKGILERASADWVCSPEVAIDAMAAPATFLGEGAIRYREMIRGRLPDAQILGENYAAPHAASVARKGLEQWRSSGHGAPGDVRPVYLRKSHAEVARDLKSSEVGSP